MGVARASLGELPLDHEDKSSLEALDVRRRYRSDKSDGVGPIGGADRSELYRFNQFSAEVLANTLICLINQAQLPALAANEKPLKKNFLPAADSPKECITPVRTPGKSKLDLL